MKSLFAELRRRNVFRVAGVYVVVGWLLAQTAVVLETSLSLKKPGSIPRASARCRVSACKRSNLMKHLSITLVLGLSLLTHSALADDAAERAAVLELLDRTFEAIAAGDPDMWRPLYIDEARELSFRPDPNGPEGALIMRERSYRDSLVAMAPGEARYFERWLGEPMVLIRGPIAVVWGEYDFWIDGKFSHCGVDTVNLAKVDGAWKIAHFMWTVEPEGCATATDAPPASAGR